ncbi:YkvA family protein [Sutcliffiella sp. NPDC057660]|uniref:YkvA family protein n=1 Tax=Sutcliffiella sp. NPDC057660 TaxID=3346199 RepID=UPI00369663EA
MFWKKKYLSGQQKTEIIDMEEINGQTKNKAAEYLKDMNKLKNLLRRAENKAKKKEVDKGFVQETWESLKTMFELVKAYIKGDYRNIPYGSLLMIIGAILYFVMPLDTIPDAMVALGFTDDAAVIALTYRKVKKDIDKFVEWKQEHDVNTPAEGEDNEST